MHFCTKCNNMYYLKIANEDDDTLIYYCRNCGHEDNILTKDNVCVLDTTTQDNSQKYRHVINEYTKFDPTLPRINTIRCPNSSCSSNRDGEVLETKSETSSENNDREVIYIRYDDTNMKYIYMCAKCSTIWKTSEQQ